MEEPALDRSLRKQAGDLNAQACKLLYVLRDFDIVRLRAPCDLPKHPLATAASNGAPSRAGRANPQTPTGISVPVPLVLE
ncbi:hypothetical protein Aduo_015251 [Ancylostoma duodenale]